jgi:NAD-dependent deacetylase
MSDPCLRDYQRIVFFTGAGMSAESGVPTYRGAGGIWKEYDYRRYACQAPSTATPRPCGSSTTSAAAWSRSATRTSATADRRAESIAPAASPSSPRTSTACTPAPAAPHVHELHGNLWRVRCDRCGVKVQDGAVLREQLRCPTCNSWWRPDIVWFEDYLDDAVVQAATAAILACDLFVSIGTSAVVYPAASLPQYAAENGALCVEINPDPTPASHLYAVHLRGPATAMLARLAAGAPELLA